MIHWQRVTELRGEVGAENFDDVVELFIEEVQEVLARLHDSPALGTLEQDLHFLKGGALSLGFNGFGDLCQAGERQSAAGQAAAVDIDAIIRAFETSRDAFQAGLADRL
ncbi:Hpt domain-containing protein [Cribrihabitans marinus]|uniref:Hpt domain-containing protein n=1 Tax=Cribrihabitans marinus TaxID=1227549 RepID=A0A1H6YPI4_9RHOB|nr:Hpt domain-containing protein [Cribrihabitans marinus]GGH28998.1 nickel transporter [Cribrihabitans marinus]SEJ39152.1 Hpt domain-containing protein [Cribrihabitans marinus]